MFGRLEARKPLTNKGDDLILSDAGTLFQFQKSARHLAPCVIWFGHHCLQKHGGVLHQYPLHLDRADVFAA